MVDRIFKGECGIEGCGRPIEASGLCASHRSRKSRKRTVSGELRRRTSTPYEGISAAAIAYADAAAEGSDEDFELAKWRWKRALARYKRASARTNGMPK